jgi:hypothetical protein
MSAGRRQGPAREVHRHGSLADSDRMVEVAAPDTRDEPRLGARPNSLNSRDIPRSFRIVQTLLRSAHLLATSEQTRPRSGYVKLIVACAVHAVLHIPRRRSQSRLPQISRTASHSELPFVVLQHVDHLLHGSLDQFDLAEGGPVNRRRRHPRSTSKPRSEPSSNSPPTPSTLAVGNRPMSPGILRNVNDYLVAPLLNPSRSIIIANETWIVGHPSKSTAAALITEINNTDFPWKSVPARRAVARRTLVEGSW